jgi:2-keto-4-pentenoate hydratase/2-oxohepta-3-ene-1,7-dioic acid hydratase in catechol pathway
VLETRVNGKVVQHASTQQLIFPIPVLIAYLSTFTTLQPGDVIVSGTPGGIGLTRNPPEFLQPGDVVEVEVSKVGVLRNTVQQELR